MPTDSMYYTMSKLLMPGIDNDEIFALSEKIIDNDWTVSNLTCTAGRPYVSNGIWDLTPSADRFFDEKEKMTGMIAALFKDDHEIMYNIMVAELMYQRNDCYNALILIVSCIPRLRERQNMRMLFAALTLEMFILVSSGQSSDRASLMDNLRNQLVSNKIEEYIPNVEALDAWLAMYDGDYARLAKWMREESPDEFSRFCMLDLFRYTIKMRAYIIQGKYMLATALANKLLPLCIAGKRYKDTCEIYLLLAMSEHAAGRTDEALENMCKAMELAEKYRYDRLIADEGLRMLELLRLYRKKYGKAPYLDRVIELSSQVASLFPGYLKSQLPEKPALTPTELKVLRFVAEEYTNAQVAHLTDTKVDTVKVHLKHICGKLEVENRHQAVKRAIELGILNPI